MNARRKASPFSFSRHRMREMEPRESKKAKSAAKGKGSFFFLLPLWLFIGCLGWSGPSGAFVLAETRVWGSSVSSAPCFGPESDLTADLRWENRKSSVGVAACCCNAPRELTRKQALRAQKDALGIPRSQQPSRSWTVHDPKRVQGPGVRDSNPRNQGRIYEYEVATPGGGTKKVYISDHHRDPMHGGIGHTHTGTPKPGASSVEPGGRYMETGEIVPYGSR